MLPAADHAATDPPLARARGGTWRRRLGEWRQAAPFVAPTLVGLTVFAAFPVLASFGFSFTSWDLLRPPRFVGLDNYVALATSPLFYRIVLNTLYYLALYVPLAVVLPFLLALALDRRLRLGSLYRTVYFLPFVTSMVAIALVWRFIFSADHGPINEMLAMLGIRGPRWFQDPVWAMPAVALVSAWKIAGYNMVIYLAGLKTIPPEYYEAAALDGATGWRKLRYLTIPLASPSLFIVLILSIVSSFQVFDATYVLTEGGPFNATMTLAYYIYQQAFQYFNMGYASAVAWLLFALTILVTLVQFRWQRRWVLYE